MHELPRRLIAALLILFSVVVARGSQAEDALPGRILFIGNSYTGGTKAGIEFFLKQADRDVQLQFIHPGGRRLSNHAENEKTLQTISEGKWDLVVLQEQSQIPSLPNMRDDYLQAGVLLTQAIRKADSDCLLFETWGAVTGTSRTRN